MKFKIVAAFALACIVGGLSLSFLIQSARDNACSMSCRNTFKSIGLALLNYNDSFRTLPPAITLGVDRHPKHSWRPLILNHVVASRPVYDKDDAWDGPMNVRLINGHRFHFEKPSKNTKDIGPYDGPLDFSKSYRCCAHKSTIDYSANVVAVTGRETLWPGTEARQLANIPDGANNTILLVETRTVDLYWSEPKDLIFDDMSFEINSLSAPSISSNHTTGPTIVMADGTTYRISPKTPSEVVRSLLTYQGGEAYTVEQLIRDGYIIPYR